MAALIALALPASAAAHATLLRTVPANGAVLTRAPVAVRVVFDDTVQVASGNAAIANATRASVVSGTPSARGDTLTIPLRHGLGEGDYSVRWSIVSDDGHHEQGVISFAVGTGRAPPSSLLTATVSLGPLAALLRGLFFLGLLVAAGACMFVVRVRPVVRDISRRLPPLLFFALLVAFVGAGGLAYESVGGTRNALVLKIAAAVAFAGAAAAATAPVAPRLLPVAGACSLVLVAAPALAGHALDPDQPRALAVPDDVLHVAAAAVWLGGLVGAVWLLPRVDTTSRSRALRRLSALLVVAVLVLALTGVGRALTELSSVPQIWSTSYGRALIVKTALFAVLLVLGAMNRRRVRSAFATVRRFASVELVLLLTVIGTVSVLVQLRPGRVVHPAAAAPAFTTPTPPALPPRGAVVDAHELGDLAVAVARTPGHAVVTLLGPDGGGANRSSVRIDGHRATPCGSGCYEGSARSGALTVRVGAKSVRFTISPDAPSERALLARVTATYRSQHSASFDESLTSGLGETLSTRFVLVAPDSLSYVIRGGSQAIVIGARRWDRASPGAKWVESQQTPLDVMHPYWGAVTNVHLVAPNTLTFLDRSIPAWFRVTIGGTPLLPRTTHMTAAAHFMVDRYVGYGDSPAPSPPSR
ncbi:MAG TPA: copper resistance protein CopC [Gaiellaceae bacterium]|nr:copper resistance protein CopC [Gaiellaceae bacterium]